MSWIRRLTDRALDGSVALSFDRTGFARHAKGFDPSDLEVDLTGRSVVVTGANSGIGKATARALAARGARVWMLCRSATRGEAARAELAADTGGDLRLVVADMASLASIDTAVARVEGPLHALVHNAGTLPDERLLTEDGLELTVAVHCAGPLRLTWGLRDQLGPGARVIWVSSGGMYTQRLEVDVLERHEGAYDGVVAYARTKRAQVVLAELLAARRPDWIVSSMHPGWADTPGVERALPGFHAVSRAILRSPEEGADTVIWLAAAERATSSGRFWFDRAPRGTHLIPGRRAAEGEHERLWERACRWARLPSDAFWTR